MRNYWSTHSNSMSSTSKSNRSYTSKYRYMRVYTQTGTHTLTAVSEVTCTASNGPELILVTSQTAGEHLCNQLKYYSDLSKPSPPPTPPLKVETLNRSKSLHLCNQSDLGFLFLNIQHNTYRGCYHAFCRPFLWDTEKTSPVILPTSYKGECMRTHTHFLLEWNIGHCLQCCLSFSQVAYSTLQPTTYTSQQPPLQPSQSESTTRKPRDDAGTWYTHTVSVSHWAISGLPNLIMIK